MGGKLFSIVLSYGSRRSIRWSWRSFARAEEHVNDRDCEAFAPRMHSLALLSAITSHQFRLFLSRRGRNALRPANAPEEGPSV
jgi:hypothetical protein